MRIEVILYILLAMLCCYDIYDNHVTTSQRCESYDLIKESFNINASYFDVHGYYNYDDKYYCVLTNTLDVEMINHTDYHEMCHALIDENYQHFCEDENAYDDVPGN